MAGLPREKSLVLPFLGQRYIEAQLSEIKRPKPKINKAAVRPACSAP